MYIYIYRERERETHVICTCDGQGLQRRPLPDGAPGHRGKLLREQRQSYNSKFVGVSSIIAPSIIAPSIQ